uniref:Putative corticosteroid 11-beta-dehydrogenase n=1 Tax=Panstrongylus lignarius TaxID=156445 RepID=A0A224XS70_9HEMI
MVEPTTVFAFCIITTAIMAAFLYNLYRRNNIHKINVKTTVLITGCDSGLGYSFARHCNELGMTVFSCVFNENSLGAKDLKSRKNTYVLRLDVTDKKSINNLQANVNKIVTNQQYDFLGIVNNSGVMVFGEFEWLTEDQIDNQINVNFRGVTQVTKAFLPLLRKYKGRIINVSSHCSMVPLPTLSIYAGTKAAIDAWSSALRMELDKFDVKVITLTPGKCSREQT